MRYHHTILALLGVWALAAEPARAQGLPATSAPGGASAGSPALHPNTLVTAELAGNALPGPPWFEHVRAFSAGASVQIAVDPGRFPAVVGATAGVYVVASRTSGEWMQDRSLVDVAGGPRLVTFVGGSIRNNIRTVDKGTLSGAASEGLGVGYDVVVDLDRSGDLSDHDMIDGFGSAAGLYVVHDLTQPGPHPVTSLTYSGGTWLGQIAYYPTDIAALGRLPLVVISHGNGHNYLWYGHIGEHLASYGYVVMSHQNNTGPGIQTASVTTLTNTDYILTHLNVIGGGVLDGHVDSHQIVWIGHSRGGEGVTRAYDAIHDGETTLNTAYGLEDIKLVSSIAPTDFLGATKSNPHGVAYSLWTGGADSDVNGCADCDICQTFHLFDRAEGTRHSISLHGAGHGDFHDGGGSSWAEGPCKIGRSKTHTIMLGYLLPLLEHHLRHNVPAKDFLWRQYERFHPIGAPVGDPCVVVDLMYEAGETPGKLVLDDFQTNPAVDQSSVGGSVAFTVANLVEGRLDDGNVTFTDAPAADAMNGMTHAGPTDGGRGIVFDFDGADAYLSFRVPLHLRDFTSYRFLSFRAAQATRHALTVAELGDITFTVTLRDSAGRASSIEIGAYGGGIEEPYQRGQCGTGNGWANEWETVRIRLTDFLHDAILDLESIAAVDFEFGPSFGSVRGRLGLDEIELLRD
ncbi:MAG: hypothetical protein AB1726_02280 [Planctomycetota bacterium]